MKASNHIEELIAQGEHQQLDFKFEISDSKKIARSLSAFANTDGGRLLIGVKDNGAISGIRSEEEYYMIEAASQMYTRPSVPFTATRWSLSGKTVLEITIVPGNDKPYLAPDKDDRFMAFIRVADENILANRILVDAWRKSKLPQGRLLRIEKPVEWLFDYLKSYDEISARQFCRLTRIPFSKGYGMLSDLLAMNAIEYFVRNKQILFRKSSEDPKEV